MKMLKCLIIASSMLLCKGANGMDSLSWIGRNLGHVAEQAQEAASVAGQAVVAAGQAGMALFKNAGDVLSFNDLPHEIKKVLFALGLNQCDLTEKIRYIGRLRRVCKDWNEMLREEDILKEFLPPILLNEGGLGSLLTKKQLTPAEGIYLACLFNDRILANADALEGLCRGLETACSQSSLVAPAGNEVQEPKIFLLRSVAPADGELITRCVAKKRNCVFKPFGQKLSSWQGVYPFSSNCMMSINYERIALDEIASTDPCVCLAHIDEKNHWVDSPFSLNEHEGKQFLEYVLATSHKNVWVITVQDVAVLPKDFVTKCHIIDFAKPTLVERRIVLELCVAQLRKFGNQSSREQLLQKEIDSISIFDPPPLPPFISDSTFKATAVTCGIKLVMMASFAFDRQESVKRMVPYFVIEEGAFLPARVNEIARRLEGYSPDDIRILFSNFIFAARGDLPNTITADIVDACVRQFLERRRNQ